MLGDDLEAWLAESALMKRTFRTCAIISGLITPLPGEEKSRRQMTISTDLVYDVLRKHQPDHVLLRAARADAATGLLDIRRSAKCCRASGAESSIRRSTMFPHWPCRSCWRSAAKQFMAKHRRQLLAEAADELVKEAMEKTVRTCCQTTDP